jgi:Protein of unknown function (DUF4239)
VLRALVDDVPSFALVLLAVGLTVAIVLGGVWLVRRFVPATKEGFDAEVSSQVLGVVAAIFGLFLAFVIVIEFQNFDNAQGSVDDEANALAAITRDSKAFTPSDGNRIRSAVGAYVRVVVSDEFPRMRRGHESASALAAVDRMYGALQAIRPRSQTEIAFYGDAVTQLNQSLIARRERIAAARGGLPKLVLAMVAIGSVVILGYAMLVGSRSFWFHAIGAGAIALVVALSLVVLVDLSYPFSGDLSIGSHEFTTGALAQFFPN